MQAPAETLAAAEASTEAKPASAVTPKRETRLIADATASESTPGNGDDAAAAVELIGIIEYSAHRR